MEVQLLGFINTFALFGSSIYMDWFPWLVHFNEIKTRLKLEQRPFTTAITLGREVVGHPPQTAARPMSLQNDKR